MELFLTACAVSYAHEELLLPEMRTRGFRELPTDTAKRYLGGYEGRAWAGTVRAKRFVVALMPDKGCTVIAHDGEIGQIKAAVESWVPSASTGISTKIERGAPRGMVQTTGYELRGGNVRERWVVTVSSDPASEIKALLSWSPL
jgi:hypothetical protein